MGAYSLICSTYGLISECAGEKTKNPSLDHTSVQLDLCLLQEEEFIAAIYHCGKLDSTFLVLVV